MLIPGHVETMNLFFDATNMSLMSTPMDLLKRIVSECLNGFATRINRTFVLGLGFFSRQGYKVIYYFLPEFTRSVLDVVADSDMKKIMG